MGINEKKGHLIELIKNLESEETLSILEMTLEFHAQNAQSDVTDMLSKTQFRELNDIMLEPSDQDTLDQKEFDLKFARWKGR